METPKPDVSDVRKHPGIAGQFSVSATVTYPGETPETITFVGHVHGGPVVMITPSGAQRFVEDPGRFGKFGTDWVRAFFA